MWRRHSHGPSSNAERTIFQELQSRHLCQHMTTQEPFTFDLEADMVPGTTIDFYWHHPHRYAVFIDGPHHDKVRQGRKDEAINLALKKRGVKVERFSYNVPLRKFRLKQICDRIQTVLNGDTR